MGLTGKYVQLQGYPTMAITCGGGCGFVWRRAQSQHMHGRWLTCDIVEDTVCAVRSRSLVDAQPLPCRRRALNGD